MAVSSLNSIVLPDEKLAASFSFESFNGTTQTTTAGLTS